MERSVLGLVTIGQAPHEDVTRSMFGNPPAFIEAGALDDLENNAIESLAPAGDDHVLVTRLADGREVVVGKERLLPFVQAAVDRVVERGASVVCILCTGAFPELRSDALLIFPDRLLTGALDAVLPAGTIGVLMPHPGQHDSMVEKWTNARRTAVTASVSPYGGADGIGEAMRSLVAGGVDMVVMDCMGFDRKMLADARASAPVPVVLANGLVGAVLQELVGSAVAAQVGMRTRSGS
mgnify:CR=1 FL=1